MVPNEIERIILRYVEDLVLMDEFCNAKQFKMIERTNRTCQTLDNWDVDHRFYHPIIETEIYTVMANTIVGSYRDAIYYIRQLAYKTHDLSCEYTRATGTEKEHKLAQMLFLFEFGRKLIPIDFRAVAHYFFNVNTTMMKPGYAGFSELIPLAYFTLNANPFIEPVQYATNHFMYTTLTMECV